MAGTHESASGSRSDASSVDASTPCECSTIGALLRAQARRRGDAHAFVFSGGERAARDDGADRDPTVRIGYRALDARTDRVAKALVGEGLEPGARVAFIGRDHEHAYDVLLGAAKVGVVTLGVNWRLTPHEIGFILDDADARLVFVDPEFAEPLAEAFAALADLVRVVVLEPRTAASGLDAFERWCDDAASRAGVDDAELDRRIARTGADDVVAQMYTSGTTGLPKGVQLAHRSFFAVMRELHRAGDPWIGWREDDVSLLVIPSFHIGGLWWALTGLVAGATNVVLPAFDAAATVAAVERHRVTKVCMVPAMIRMVLSDDLLDRTDTRSLEWVVYGGSPIPRTMLVEAQQRLACRFAQIYGLTETGNTAVCLRDEDHADPASQLLLAAGRPYPGVRVRVVDEDGVDLAARAIGEILIDSPANMIGYWKREEATAETLRDGWIWTGDAGYLDEDGYVYVCDRKKDMILYAGENVYPAEIEAALCAHEDVAECAVIGVPDERWGELVKAIVVPEPGRSLNRRRLLAFARERLADFKVPKSIDVADALPRTPSGKLKKHELREPYWRGRERRVN